jgi:hypothetical protein
MNIPMFFPLTGGQNQSANQSFQRRPTDDKAGNGSV